MSDERGKRLRGREAKLSTVQQLILPIVLRFLTRRRFPLHFPIRRIKVHSITLGHSSMAPGSLSSRVTRPLVSRSKHSISHTHTRICAWHSKLACRTNAVFVSWYFVFGKRVHAETMRSPRSSKRLMGEFSDNNRQCIFPFHSRARTPQHRDKAEISRSCSAGCEHSNGVAAAAHQR